MAFAGQLGADVLAHVIDAAAFHDAVGSGEVDVFEDAKAVRDLGEGFEAVQPLFVDDDDLPRFHVAHELGVDDIQGAGLRR